MGNTTSQVVDIESQEITQYFNKKKVSETEILKDKT